MSLLTSISNKVQYMVAQNVSDPDADAYAKQQADQAAAAAATKAQQDEAAKQAAIDLADKQKKDADAAALAARSNFNSSELIGQTARSILSGLGGLVLACFLLYGGHIAANKVIGYRVPFRILSFICGMIFSIWVIPKSLYDVYWKKETLPYYTFLPISTYQPVGDLEKIFLGGFCYVEDETVEAARAAVKTLYSEAFTKSVEAAKAMATPIATPIAAPIK